MSSGAPYSYALGYKFPAKVRHIFIFSGLPALYDEFVLSQWPHPPIHNQSMSEVQKLARQLFFQNLTGDDLQIADIRDSMMNDCFGVAQDLKIRCMDWGFALSNIKQTVYMEHSRTDHDVPFITAEITAKMIPNCQLSIREGEHFSAEALDAFIKNTMLSQ